MEQKIIFWIDEGYIPFCIANFLKEKIHSKFFAIFDINYVTSNFFKSQKLINFEQSWFFRENISTHKHPVDIEYLKQIEKKYQINLWQLAYSERRFYYYNEYKKFSYDEILSIT